MTICYSFKNIYKSLLWTVKEFHCRSLSSDVQENNKWKQKDVESYVRWCCLFEKGKLIYSLCLLLLSSSLPTQTGISLFRCLEANTPKYYRGLLLVERYVNLISSLCSSVWFVIFLQWTRNACIIGKMELNFIWSRQEGLKRMYGGGVYGRAAGRALSSYHLGLM